MIIIRAYGKELRNFEVTSWELYESFSILFNWERYYSIRRILWLLSSDARYSLWSEGIISTCEKLTLSIIRLISDTDENTEVVSRWEVDSIDVITVLLQDYDVSSWWFLCIRMFNFVYQHHLFYSQFSSMPIN